MGSAVATRCRLTYGNRARGFHQGQSTHALTNRPVIVTQSFLCLSALQFRGSPYSLAQLRPLAGVGCRKVLCAMWRRPNPGRSFGMTALQ